MSRIWQVRHGWIREVGRFSDGESEGGDGLVWIIRFAGGGLIGADLAYLLTYVDKYFSTSRFIVHVCINETFSKTMLSRRILSAFDLVSEDFIM